MLKSQERRGQRGGGKERAKGRRSRPFKDLLLSAYRLAPLGTKANDLNSLSYFPDV
jgi:hypothetical protein